MKIRDKAYHMRCFTCCECHQRLVTGDRIHFINDRIFCENDYPHALRNMATTPKQQQQPVSRYRVDKRQIVDFLSLSLWETEILNVSSETCTTSA